MKQLIYILLALSIMSCAHKSGHKPTNTAQQQNESTGQPSLLQVKLPAGTDNDTVQYSHMAIDFNPSLRIPNCVAYELNLTQVTMADAPTAEQRSDYNFERDTAVNRCPDWWEYKNSGYSRGHMAPAMDMRWDKEAMAQCFYMTNICPQSKDLNGGRWRSMEEAIHRWARKSERLIIFTGPVLSKNMKRIGDNNDIAVPQAFFKVVYNPTTQRAIAFVMENRKLDMSWKNYAVTVDEVERLTGIDFLACLDDSIENTVESTCDIKNWP